MTVETNADLALQLMKNSRNGVLSSFSQNLPGYPFGSLASFSMVQSNGMWMPVMFLSDLAEHTANIKADARVSLMVLEKSESPQAAGRVTWVGNAIVADHLKEECFSSNPEMKKYSAMHDFHAYAISCMRVRYIGGFGKIFWVEPEELVQPDLL